TNKKELNVSYIVPSERNPRGGIDLPTFAADLVKALNALDANPAIEARIANEQTDYPNEHQNIDIGNATRLWLTADNWKKRVRVSIHATDVQHGDRNTYNKDHRTEDATVNPDGRSIDSIARDIKRRVIDASAAALKLQRDYAAAQASNRASIKDRAEALAKACPMLSVKLNEREQNASLYFNHGGGYLSGTLSHDGNVRMRDVSGISADNMPALLKLFSVKS
ncbi:MAG: hypothetical protein J2P55_02065, partial [Rhizobiales bacterium]|nr:hypothetical protein [Hyphomicrobiales bacterium]